MPGLSGKLISFYIVLPVVECRYDSRSDSNRLDPACKAGLAGHVPVNNLTFSKEVSSWEKG